eukprot:760565-Hanusia_phi.AAC.1
MQNIQHVSQSSSENHGRHISSSRRAEGKDREDRRDARTAEAGDRKDLVVLEQKQEDECWYQEGDGDREKKD